MYSLKISPVKGMEVGSNYYKKFSETRLFECFYYLYGNFKSAFKLAGGIGKSLNTLQITSDLGKIITQTVSNMREK